MRRWLPVDVKSEVFTQIFGGSIGTIHVASDYKDPASAQAVQAKLMVDEGYWALAHELAEVILESPTVSLLQLV
jgi:hypothetical protein